MSLFGWAVWRVEAQADDAPTICLDTFEAPAGRVADAFAGLEDSPGKHEGKAAERVYFVIFRGEARVDDLGELVELSGVPSALYRRRLRGSTRPWRSSTACTVLFAGVGTIGKLRMSFSRIFTAPQVGCSWRSVTIVRST